MSTINDLVHKGRNDAAQFELLKQRVLTAAEAEPVWLENAGKMNAHQWGYLYGVKAGHPAPSPEDIGLGDGTQMLTGDEYFAALAGAR